MKILRTMLVAAMLANCQQPLRSADAAEYRCSSYCPTWNQCFSRCSWFYSEQEIYEQRQNRALQNLDHDTRGGTRRPSNEACTAAIEAGVENGTLGCRQ